MLPERALAIRRSLTLSAMHVLPQKSIKGQRSPSVPALQKLVAS
ncbi:MAG TPA: hypothetical protein V6D12_08170 [Candidatus Obscuribacterales bacterium]